MRSVPGSITLSRFPTTDREGTEKGGGRRRRPFDVALRWKGERGKEIIGKKNGRKPVVAQSEEMRKKEKVEKKKRGKIKKKRKEGRQARSRGFPALFRHLVPGEGKGGEGKKKKSGKKREEKSLNGLLHILSLKLAGREGERREWKKKKGERGGKGRPFSKTEVRK